MALDRPDVRFYVDDDVHKALKSICSHRDISLTDFMEALLIREIKAIGHDAIGLADELRDLGFFRKNPESPGDGRK